MIWFKVFVVLNLYVQQWSSIRWLAEDCYVLSVTERYYIYTKSIKSGLSSSLVRFSLSVLLVTQFSRRYVSRKKRSLYNKLGIFTKSGIMNPVCTYPKAQYMRTCTLHLLIPNEQCIHTLFQNNTGALYSQLKENRPFFDGWGRKRVTDKIHNALQTSFLTCTKRFLLLTY